HRNHFAPDRGVGVDTGDTPGCADQLPHQTHDLTRPAPNVEAAHPFSYVETFEDAPRGGLPQLGLAAESLVLRQGPSENVLVGRPLPRLGLHSSASQFDLGSGAQRMREV